MFKTEINKAKKLARRISSLHSYLHPDKPPQEHPPLPPKPPQQENALPPQTPLPSDTPKDLVQAATSQQIREWDQGIFQLSLVRHDIYPQEKPGNIEATKLPANTYQGTKRALTQAYYSIENRYLKTADVSSLSNLVFRFGTFYDAVNYEPSLAQDRSLEECRQLYQYQLPEEGQKGQYPPHLNIIPPQVRVNQFFGPNHLFDHMRLLDTASVLPQIIPGKILDWLHGSPERTTFNQIRDREQTLRRKHEDIYNTPNIGDRQDWYSDAVFAQQQFTGANPITITRASAEWISQFKEAAQIQGNAGVRKLLDQGPTDSFYVQDCSYFRKAIGLSASEPIQSCKQQQHHHLFQHDRYLCATVTLFQLSGVGKLHPLSIVIDYKGSIADSVVIFNDRLDSTASTYSEETNWPWRYAKICAQVADWTRHEITIHLTNAHLVEEAAIVACNRTLPSDHVVYKLLQPHWFKTLSLNKAARSTLVPHVIAPIARMSQEGIYSFIRHAYSTFDWPSLNIPADLERRGFPVAELNSSPKYHNYAYGRNLLLMWQVLGKFVLSVLKLAYGSDEDVAKDLYVQALATEMRSASGGQLPSFPELQSLSALADAVTMMIHIASPQHTAVNYTQDYYQSFLPNKPTALYTPPPLTHNELQRFTEKDLIAALPVHLPHDWLLATHLPHLLSYRVAEEQNLVTYAISLS